MIDAYARILGLLSLRERRQFFALFALLLGVGAVEAVGVASILPFLALAADPSLLERDETLGRLHALSGAADGRAFLMMLGAGLFCVIVFGLLFKAAVFHLLFRFTSMRMHSLALRLMRGYLAQPYVWFLDRNSALLGKTMLSEVDRLVQKVLAPALKLLAHGVIVLFIAGLLVAANPVAALGAATLIGAAYSVAYLAARGRLHRRGRAQLRENAARFKAVAEAFGGVKDVKALGLERICLERFRDPAARVARTESQLLTLTEAPRYLIEAAAFGGMLLFALALLAGGEDAGGGAARMTEALPLLGLYAFAVIRLFPACQQMFAAFAKLRFGAAILHEMQANLAIAAAPKEPAPAVPPEPLGLRRAIVLRDVRFRYPRASRLALDGLSLEIAAGATVGIVGPSGAGKTTALDVILGLLSPDEGALEVDGAVVGPDAARAWRATIGYAPQQIYLADDTVAANIAFGAAPGAIDMAAVERAARIAAIHDFVTGELPEGYRTNTGERGVRLSGGQRQRIGLARALYRDPDVLVLDEATSALDAATERAVMEAVAALGRRKTLIIVAHRLSSVRACDEIFVLEGGRLAARGDYDALLRDSPAFRRLAQAGRDDDDGAAQPAAATSS